MENRESLPSFGKLRQFQREAAKLNLEATVERQPCQPGMLTTSLRPVAEFFCNIDNVALLLHQVRRGAAQPVEQLRKRSDDHSEQEAKDGVRGEKKTERIVLPL